MRNIILLLIVINLSGCSHKIVRNYQVNAATSTIENVDVLIVKKKNLFGLSKKYLGTIKLDDTGVSLKCSERIAINILKQDAQKTGANVINITEEVYPGMSTCYRCVADFYQINIDKTTEEILNKEIRTIYPCELDNKIKWTYFERQLPDSSSAPYVFVPNIELYSGGASFWDGKPKDFKAKGVFYADVSMIKSTYPDSLNTSHIAGLNDLTFIYAKKAENLLNTTELKMPYFQNVQLILEEKLQELFLELEKYMLETKYGGNNEIQEKWNKKINDELKKI